MKAIYHMDTGERLIAQNNGKTVLVLCGRWVEPYATMTAEKHVTCKACIKKLRATRPEE